MFKILEKAFLPLVFALFIDGLQALMSVTFFSIGAALQGITPVGGGVAGVVAGATYCWNSTAGIWSALAAGAKCAVGGGIAGAASSAAGVPLGIALGFVVNAAISLTFGVGLIMFMGMLGMWYPFTMGAALFGEVAPGFDMLPMWTGTVLWCAFKKLKEEPGALGAAANVAGAILTPSPAAFVGAARTMDGIRRPANDNVLYAEAA
jgi:hypothetical protein